ncbi:MAG: TIR domain-containing protein [Hellea sp.]|nr:TIR domain-containing protein [Hellea sp.]
MGPNKYKAFLSYSHRNERWASWLHRRLETYRFPGKTVGQITEAGPVPERFQPIFRDREELTAGADLGVKIEAALRDSDNLIVICSPDAVSSNWVNEEILYFKRHNNPERIFAAIVDGTPFADPAKGERECLPEALRFKLGNDGKLSNRPAEPLAADFREDFDGKRVGFLKLLSGLVGLGLNDLVQRDLQRARRRVTWITLSALTAVIVMGSLTWFAVDARKEAESRRSDAEGLIQFMLTDLRDRLEPVGKLDVLDSVGQKAAEYYESYDPDDHGADALGRRAIVFHLLGDIQMRMGNISAAKAYFGPAFATTHSQLEQDPDNPERIYEHAQSVYWSSVPFRRARQYDEDLNRQQEYLVLANRLFEIEDATDRAILERAYAESNIGQNYYESGELEKARTYFKRAEPLFQDIYARRKTTKSYLEVSRILTEIATIELSLGDAQSATDILKENLVVLERLLAENPDDFQIRSALIFVNIKLAVSERALEKFETAETRLLAQRDLIEQNLLREPNDDRLKRYRLTVLDELITVCRLTRQDDKAKALARQFGQYLDARADESAQSDFDVEWDVRLPFKFARNEVFYALKENDFSAARAALGRYKDLMDRIKDRDELFAEYRDIRFYYNLSKAFLEADYDAYKNLSNWTDKSESDTRAFVMFKLMEYYFCEARSICPSQGQNFNSKDLDRFEFEIFNLLYPDSAQAIKSKFIEQGDDNE